jgi:alpha-L-rhamnosidase
MANAQRFDINPVRQLADLNILQQYEIQKAAWIWHPEFAVTQDPHVLVFKCAVELTEDTQLRIHVSADQRYELSLDGELISRGPDRCDLSHWSFASYEIRLPAGEHVFSARAWWLGRHMPIAQVTSGRGGFIVGAEGSLSEVLNTGSGNWQVAHARGWGFGGGLRGHYHAIGSAMQLDGAKMCQALEWVEPVVVRAPLVPSKTGVVQEGWRLYPSALPDQLWDERRPGEVRAVSGSGDAFVSEKDLTPPDIAKWQALIEDQTPVRVESGAHLRVFWDLGDYYCGYPEIRLSEGKNAAVKILWAESLFEEDIDVVYPRLKGNRNTILGKRFFGFGDTIKHGGGASITYRPLWWRSGRYILMEIACEGEPLTVESLAIVETRYPVENEGGFTSSDPALDGIIPLAVRGIQMCSHETFMDCPYYEQLMYVGDTRLEMLTTYAMTADTRLVKRGIELFDWSRHSNGFVAERYPSTPSQVSLTFSMIWVALLRDSAWWRDDGPWVRDRMVGMRNMLEHVRHLINQDGLLEALPGWSFIDWVPGWEYGMPVGARSGISSVVNLFFVMALKYAAELERDLGDPALAERNEGLAKALGERLIDVFWDHERGLFSDEVEHRSFSEHAQCLALLTDVLDSGKTEICLHNLLTDRKLHRATVYFSYYLFEVLHRFQRHDLLMEKLAFWKNLVDVGFKTPVEKPEPSRSDCHAWGAHPLFHFHASLAGVRPDAPGFGHVRVAPHPAGLTTLQSHLPHPRGFVDVDLAFADESTVVGRVDLPPSTAGVFVWRGQEIELGPGDNAIQLGAPPAERMARP